MLALLARYARHGARTSKGFFALRRDAFPEDLAELKDVVEEVAHALYWGVVEDGGKVVGYVQLSDSDGVNHLEGIAVDTEVRRRGHGEALLLAALAWVRDNRPGPVRLYTDFWRTEAMALYKKYGFRQLFTGVQFARTMNQEEIEAILARRKNTYSRWVGFR